MPTVVTNDVLFHEPGRRILQDVVTCIRHNVTIDELGDRRERHADRYLKPPEEMHRLFARYPEALARTTGDRRALPLLAGRTRLPVSRGARRSGADAAGDIGEADLGRRRRSATPKACPESVRATLEHELSLIEKLDYAPYFLTVNSIVRFARSQDILCQGRGSAANSAVCYVLGITSIDPGRNDLLFERFVSEERREPPDIDVDFEHERREIVMQWVFDTYGRDHAALCSTVIRYRTKGALARRRQGARAAGGPDQDALVASLGLVGGQASMTKHVQELNLNLGDRRLAPGARSRPPAPGRAAALRPASGRLRPDPRSPRRPGADRARPRWMTARSSNGTRTTSTRFAS